MARSFARWRGGQRLLDRLDDMLTLDTTDVAQEVQADLIAGNRAARLGGLDKDGKALWPLKRKRRGPYAGFGGPPLAPRGELSNSVSGFYAVIERIAGGFRVRYGNQSPLRKVFDYHGEGRVKGAPRRDIRGVPESTLEEIRGSVRSGLFERFRRAFRGK